MCYLVGGSLFAWWVRQMTDEAKAQRPWRPLCAQRAGALGMPSVLPVQDASSARVIARTVLA